MRTMKTILTSLFLIGGLLFANQHTQAAGEAELNLHHTLDTYRVEKVAFSPDSKLLFVAQENSSFLFHVENGSKIELEHLSYEMVHDAAFSPDGSLLAVSGEYYGLNIFDSRSGSLIATIEKNDPIYGPERMVAQSLAFSQDGKTLIAGLGWDGIRIIDTDTYQELRSFPSGEYVTKVRSHTTKKDFVIASYQDYSLQPKLILQIRNMANGNITKSFGILVSDARQLDHFDFNYSPDGNFLAFSYSTDEQAETLIFDAANNYNQIEAIPAYGSVSFTPDSNLLIAGDKAFPLHSKIDGLFDIKVKNSDQLLYSNITLLSPDGKYLLTQLLPDKSVIYNSDIDGADISLLDASALGERLIEIQIAPNPIVIEPNEKLSLKLTGIYSNGTKKGLDVSKATWSTANFYIAKSERNLLQGIGHGVTSVSAKYGNLSTSVQVTVAEKPAKLQGQLKESSATLNWSTVNTEEFMGYYLYRRALDGTYSDTPITDFPLQTTNYTDSTVSSEQDYYYVVKAVYKDGIQSGPSNEILLSSRLKQIVLQVNNPHMTVNGVAKEIDAGNGTAPVIQKGRTILPIRAVIEEMGGTLEWVEPERKIFIELNGLTVELQIDNNKAKVNGVEHTLDVAPVIINKRTMIPLRFVSENLGLELDWNGETQSITLTNK